MLKWLRKLRNEMSLDKIDDWNWNEAFNFADGFTRDDVERVIAASEGYNDGDSWVGVFQLKDGRYAYLTAWCDYTGWDCRAGGNSDTRKTLDEIIRECCGDDDRQRLGLKLPEDKK